MLQELWEIRQEVKNKRPLVLNITNNVVTNFTANVLLAVGASPIMSEGIAEAEDLIKICDVVVLNIGTLHPRQCEYFLQAGKIANQFNKPVILDPVGLGASGLRNDMVERILKEVKVSVIRGNYGEINYLMGSVGLTKGVDSFSNSINLEAIKGFVANKETLIVATGEKDYVVSKDSVNINNTGHEILQMVTGTGCALSSLVGAFFATASQKEIGVLSALVFYGAAAQKAELISNGPGTFQINFLDALYNLSYEEFSKFAV